MSRQDARAARAGPLGPDDLGPTLATLRDFSTGTTRGREPFRQSLRHRDGE